MSETKKTFVFVGCEKGAACMEVFAYDAENGAMEHLHTALEGVEVGSVRISPDKKLLYCTHHVRDYPGAAAGGGGQFLAVKIDPETGELTELNRQPSYGTMPVMMDTDPQQSFLIGTNHSQYSPTMKVSRSIDGKYCISTHYDDAPTVLYPLNEDGSIGEACDMFMHDDCSDRTSYPNPHPHCVFRSPLWELYAVCDKGADRIYMFRIDRGLKRLNLAGEYDVPAGSAPRYGAFHPTKPFLFTNNELLPVVFAFRYDEQGSLTLVNSLRTLPDGDKNAAAQPMPSDFRIHPGGKFIYGLVRHTENITVLAIDQDSGALSLIQTLTLPGKEAKACAVSPDGRYFFAAAKESGLIHIYSIAEDGTLSPTGRTVSVKAPDNITFYQAD